MILSLFTIPRVPQNNYNGISRRIRILVKLSFSKGFSFIDYDSSYHSAWKIKCGLQQKILVFGSDAMVFIGTDSTMKRSIVTVISLKESNGWGGCYFRLVCTGKKLHSCDWE